MNKYLLLLGVLIIAAIVFLIWQTQLSSKTPTTQVIPTTTQQQTQETESTQSVQFNIPKKSAHYETNTPNHGATLAGVPFNIVIDFNFDLAKPSEIKILKDGRDYGVGETIIDNNKL